MAALDDTGDDRRDDQGRIAASVNERLVENRKFGSLEGKPLRASAAPLAVIDRRDGTDDVAGTEQLRARQVRDGQRPLQDPADDEEPEGFGGRTSRNSPVADVHDNPGDSQPRFGKSELVAGQPAGEVRVDAQKSQRTQLGLRRSSLATAEVSLSRPGLVELRRTPGRSTGLGCVDVRGRVRRAGAGFSRAATRAAAREPPRQPRTIAVQSCIRGSRTPRESRPGPAAALVRCARRAHLADSRPL